MRLQESRANNKAQEIVEFRTGVDLSQPNAAEQLARSFEGSGSSLVSSHASDFSEEIIRSRNAGNDRNSNLLLTAMEIRDAELDRRTAGGILDRSLDLAESDRLVESAETLALAATVSRDVSFREFRASLSPAHARQFNQILETTPFSLLPSALRGFESLYQHQFSAQQSEQMSLMIGKIRGMEIMFEQGRTWEEISGVFDCRTRDEFMEEASKYLDEFQLRSIEQAMDYVAEDTSSGSEAEQIMQETVKQAIEQLRSQMEDMQFSRELQESLDRIIEEEESRKDGEKYSSIAERMPEGLAREIGTSDGAVEFLEMLSGVRPYDSARVAELFSNNGGEIAGGFARFLAEG